MKFYLSTLLALLLSLTSCSNHSESVTHRRNFSKNVFEEEFASVKASCDTNEMFVLVPDTKWLDIDKEHLIVDHPDLHKMELNKRFKIKERNFDHELFLEKIQNGAFMFRYNSVQSSIDTVEAVLLTSIPEDQHDRIDPARKFSFEGKNYYAVIPGQDTVLLPKTIYRKFKTEDKGRVICTCDETL